MITARVTDPDGLDDIGGGVLVDDEKGSVYGAFVQISEGTFQILLTWESVNAAEPIRFEWEGSRTYRAQFEDKDQHVGSRTIDLPFDCGGNSFGVCGDGECRPLGTTSDCEGCDKSCSAVCDEGACIVGEWSSCVVAGDVATCDNACAMLGYDACFAGACDDLGQMGLEAHAGLVYFPADEFGDACEDAPQYPELVAPMRPDAGPAQWSTDAGPLLLHSCLSPSPYMRKSPKVDEVLPLFYLRGLSTNRRTDEPPPVGPAPAGCPSEDNSVAEIDPYGWVSGFDPWGWRYHDKGALSIELWRPGQAPYRE